MSTNKIQHKRSSTLNNPPSSLDAGEIAINTNATTPHIHFEDAGGDMRSVGADPTATGNYVRRVTAAGTANDWVAVDGVPGGGDGSGDFGFWNRNDTTDTLSPREAGDNITTTGDLSAADGTFSGDVTATDFIIDQTTADVTVTAADPAAARTYTFPDEGGNRNITLDAAAPGSTTQYVRQITSAGVGSWVAANSVPGTGDGSGDFGFWSRNDGTDTLSPREANDNLDMGSGDIDTTGDVTASNFVIDQTTADVTIAAANPAAARTYTFPDEGGDRDITLDPPTQASTVQYVRQVSSAGVGTWVDTSTLPGLWQEDSGNLSPVTLSHTLSIGTRNSNGAKFRVQLENDDETVYFYGGGSRGLRINDETEVNEGDHTIFEKNTDSGRYSFRNSTGELVQIEKDGSVTLANGTGQLNAGKGVFTRWVQIEPEYGIRMTGSSKNRIELRKEDYISGIQMNPGGSIRGLEIDHQPTQVTSDSKGVVVRLVGTDLDLASNAAYAAFDTNIDNQTCDGDIIGYRGSISANMNSGSGKAYNIYCSSNAPVYVSGDIEQGGGSILQDTATTSPAFRFNGSNAEKNFYMNSGGVLYSKKTLNNPAGGTANQLRVNSTGQIQCITTLRSLMTDVEPIENIDGLAIVQQLQLKRWKDINDGEVGIGFIADDVYAAGAQSLVFTQPYDSEIHGEQPTTFGDEPLVEGASIVTNYSEAGLVGVLVEAIKQLKAENDGLNTRVEQLEAATDLELLGRIESLERENSIDDASDNALLVLVGELSQKIQALETAVGI